MELLWLKYFESAARHESMTRAAEEFMIPQSAMSQTIARLERELGVKLFTREKRRIFLNDNGKLFLEKAQTALCAIEEGMRLFKSTSNISDVTVLVLQDRGFVNECVCEFCKTHPSISFDLHYNIENDIAAELCIADKTTASQYDYCEFLFEVPIKLAVPENCPLARKKSVTFKDISEYPLVTIGKNFPLTDMIEKLLQGSNSKPSATIRCLDPHMAQKCIASGLGVAFSPIADWQELNSTGIKSIPIEDIELSRSTYLCWNNGISPIADDFKEIILKIAEKKRG